MKHRTIFCQFKTQLLPKTVKYRYGYYQYPFARKRGRKNYHNFLSEKGGGATTGAQIALVNVLLFFGFPSKMMFDLAFLQFSKTNDGASEGENNLGKNFFPFFLARVARPYRLSSF